MATKRIQTVILFALLAMGVYFGSAFALAAQAEGEGISCSMPFEATVYAGPSTGTSLVGTFNFSFDEDGGITGILSQDGQPDILVLGQAVGRAIHLAFDLSTPENPGVFIFGVGTAIDPVDSELCGTVSGGPFVGPQKGDSGDWIFGFGQVDPFEADNKKKQEAASSKQPADLTRQPVNFPSAEVQPSGFLTADVQPSGFNN